MRQPKLSIFLAYGIFIADKYENNKKKKTQQIKMKQTNEWDNQVIDGNAWEKKVRSTLWKITDLWRYIHIVRRFCDDR